MVLETLSNCKQEYEKLDSSLKNTKHLEDQEESLSFQDTCEKLAKSNAALMDSAEQLKQVLEAEKSKRQQQDDALAELQKSLHLLKDEARTLKAQIEESKTTVKVFEINQERLLISLQTEREETVHLQESNEQLLRESEGWCERVGELTEQIKMCELSNKDMEDVLNDREEQIKSITACLLKLKVWESDVDDCFEENKTWDLETRGGIENGEYLDDQQKRKVKKLLYAAKLNAALKSMEAEKNEVCTQLHNELEAKRELTERIEKLKSEEISIHSDRSCYENELQKLQQKLKVMQELYQENEMQLHRKLTVEEKQRLQKEEKLSKADEKMNLAAEELKSYRQRAQDLEDELERTIKSYQNQISLHEKKAHDNWLAARAADRELGDVKRENTHLRQKLTETEFKLDVLEKDPHALDVQNKVYLRECSPYRTAVLSRPSSETRAFLSPPTLMEGPPRLSPLFPGGPGGRGGTRGAVNYLDHPPVESGEQSSDRLSDHHGAHSDSGSLSPTWERQISVPLTGAPLRRTEPGYHMPLPSGRMSGPAELRIYSSHSLDKPDEHPSVENHLEQVPDTSAFNENVSSMLTSSRNQPIFPVRETNTDPGFIAPPAPNIRGPLLPLDPRGFFRRGPFPIHGPPDRLPPPEFIGVPPPLLRMRVPPPLPEHFLQFPPVRDGFPPVRDGFLPAGRLPPQNPHMLLARLSSPPPSQTEAESGVSQHDN
ncbi:melanoma inhibitory activity protein 2-like [Protopterus annectens]|uniref:melanoma inhibitory activity protein 2-like n=1 Tax=Protopterus annectens TaxID=7888 RepID=UPI001CFA0F07|nr:melanoma inhibitory activity protein 2-like [Protopterus annectens]